jgi:helicase required for RNAi-mediated heterochromatin assembly 1
MHNNGYQIQLNTGPREYFRAQQRIASDNEAGWQGLPEVPSSEEVAQSEDQALLIPANKIKGKWKTTGKYLQAHYELLREDSIAPIREAVDAVRKQPDMMDSNEVAIYEKVGRHHHRVRLC